MLAKKVKTTLQLLWSHRILCRCTCWLGISVSPT